jgi:hypothetical protein
MPGAWSGAWYFLFTGVGRQAEHVVFHGTFCCRGYVTGHAAVLGVAHLFSKSFI